MRTENKLYLKALGLGAVAGMRSLSAPAILSNELSSTPTDVLQGSPLRHLQSSAVSTGLNLLAASEMVADKVPGVPDRTDLASLLMRTASGALVGAAVFTAGQDSPIKGAILGGLAALAATYGFFYLRTSLGKNTEVSDVALGLVEDAIMLGSGLAIAKR
jgi:uncharacterized membrane protein